MIEVIEVTSTHYITNKGDYVRANAVLDMIDDKGLERWKKKMGVVMAEKIGKKARDIGTRVGGLVEREWKEGEYKLVKKDGKEVRSCMKAWEALKNDVNPVIIDMERTVFNDEIMVAGTYDVLTETALADIKTSAKIHDRYWLQTAFYLWTLSLNRQNSISAADEWTPEYLEIWRLDKQLKMYELERRKMEWRYVEAFKKLTKKYREVHDECRN